MKKIMALLIISTLLLTIGLSGCTDEGRFVGKWRTTPRLGISFGITFNRDKTFSVDGYPGALGEWKLDDGKLIITLYDDTEDFDIVGEFDYAFSDSGRTLTLDSGIIEVTLNK